MARQRKQPKKPIGTMGAVRIPTTGELATFSPIAFGEYKPEIERNIFDAAINNGGREVYGLIGEPTSNVEDDLDISFNSADGHEYVDLLEVAPLNGRREEALATYVHGDLSDWIWKEILRKSRKYESNVPYARHLLLYSTDWRFPVVTGVLYLIAFEASRHSHVFKTISYYRADDQKRGEFTVIYPCPPSVLETIEPAALRARRSLFFDPTQAQAQPAESQSSGSVIVPMGRIRKSQPIPPEPATPTVEGAGPGGQAGMISFVSLEIPADTPIGD